MNQNLNKAMFDIAKVDSLMYAIEKTYFDFEVAPEEHERMDRAAYAFYALWDAINRVADDLYQLAGDCRVVDAIYAARDVQRQRELETE